jgi:hypothetical protein
MNCIQCLQENSYSQSAAAICQHCGAGVCHHHFFVLKRKIPTSGMATIDRSRSLICSDCYQQLFPEKSSQATGISADLQHKSATYALTSWWKKLRKRDEKAVEEQLTVESLPEPEEAVALIERFLEGKR